MNTIAGLFRDREQALRALDDLRSAGFGGNTVTLIASPTSAGEVAEAAAETVARPRGRVVDLGAAMGGQADPDFPETERLTYEERVADGDTLIRVAVPDAAAADRAEAILLRHGAERVTPGTVRD